MEQDEKKKCCICGGTFEVGLKMNENDYICSTFKCCTEYCETEGETVYQFTDEDEELEEVE